MRRSARRVAFALVLILAPLLSGQAQGTAKPTPTAAQAPDPPPAAELARARELMHLLIERHRGHGFLRARFEQKRTTRLLSRPLLSTGELLFRREPGCVVFRIEQPRPAVVRLQETSYEVYRPEQNRLERFVLPDADMPRLLFAALSPSDDALGRDFDIVSCRVLDDDGARWRLTLRPRGDDRGDWVEQVHVDVVGSTGALVGFGYRDPRGDAVEVTLSEVELPDRLAEERLATGAPPTAEVVVSRVPARREDGKDRR